MWDRPHTRLWTAWRGLRVLLKPSGDSLRFPAGPSARIIKTCGLTDSASLLARHHESLGPRSGTARAARQPSAFGFRVDEKAHVPHLRVGVLSRLTRGAGPGCAAVGAHMVGSILYTGDSDDRPLPQPVPGASVSKGQDLVRVRPRAIS